MVYRGRTDGKYWPTSRYSPGLRRAHQFVATGSVGAAGPATGITIFCPLYGNGDPDRDPLIGVRSTVADRREYF